MMNSTNSANGPQNRSISSNQDKIPTHFEKLKEFQLRFQKNEKASPSAANETIIELAKYITENQIDLGKLPNQLEEVLLQKLMVVLALQGLKKENITSPQTATKKNITEKPIRPLSINREENKENEKPAPLVGRRVSFHKDDRSPTFHYLQGSGLRPPPMPTTAKPNTPGGRTELPKAPISGLPQHRTTSNQSTFSKTTSEKNGLTSSPTPNSPTTAKTVPPPPTTPPPTPPTTAKAVPPPPSSLPNEQITQSIVNESRPETEGLNINSRFKYELGKPERPVPSPPSENMPPITSNKSNIKQLSTHWKVYPSVRREALEEVSSNGQSKKTQPQVSVPEQRPIKSTNSPLSSSTTSSSALIDNSNLIPEKAAKKTASKITLATQRLPALRAVTPVAQNLETESNRDIKVSALKTDNVRAQLKREKSTKNLNEVRNELTTPKHPVLDIPKPKIDVPLEDQLLRGVLAGLVEQADKILKDKQAEAAKLADKSVEFFVDQKGIHEIIDYNLNNLQKSDLKNKDYYEVLKFLNNAQFKDNKNYDRMIIEILKSDQKKLKLLQPFAEELGMNVERILAIHANPNQGITALNKVLEFINNALTWDKLDNDFKLIEIIKNDPDNYKLIEPFATNLGMKPLIILDIYKKQGVEALDKISNFINNVKNSWKTSDYDSNLIKLLKDDINTYKLFLPFLENLGLENAKTIFNNSLIILETDLLIGEGLHGDADANTIANYILDNSGNSKWDKFLYNNKDKVIIEKGKGLNDIIQLVIKAKLAKNNSAENDLNIKSKEIIYHIGNALLQNRTWFKQNLLTLKEHLNVKNDEKILSFIRQVNKKGISPTEIAEQLLLLIKPNKPSRYLYPMLINKLSKEEMEHDFYKILTLELLSAENPSKFIVDLTKLINWELNIYKLPTYEELLSDISSNNIDKLPTHEEILSDISSHLDVLGYYQDENLGQETAAEILHQQLEINIQKLENTKNKSDEQIKILDNLKLLHFNNMAKRRFINFIDYKNFVFSFFKNESSSLKSKIKLDKDLKVKLENGTLSKSYKVNSVDTVRSEFDLVFDQLSLNFSTQLLQNRLEYYIKKFPKVKAKIIKRARMYEIDDKLKFATACVIRTPFSQCCTNDFKLKRSKYIFEVTYQQLVGFGKELILNNLKMVGSNEVNIKNLDNSNIQISNISTGKFISERTQFLNNHKLQISLKQNIEIWRIQAEKFSAGVFFSDVVKDFYKKNKNMILETDFDQKQWFAGIKPTFDVLEFIDPGKITPPAQLTLQLIEVTENLLSVLGKTPTYLNELSALKKQRQDKVAGMIKSKEEEYLVKDEAKLGKLKAYKARYPEGFNEFDKTPLGVELNHDFEESDPALLIINLKISRKERVRVLIDGIRENMSDPISFEKFRIAQLAQVEALIKSRKDSLDNNKDMSKESAKIIREEIIHLEQEQEIYEGLELIRNVSAYKELDAVKQQALYVHPKKLELEPEKAKRLRAVFSELIEGSTVKQLRRMPALSRFKPPPLKRGAKS